MKFNVVEHLFDGLHQFNSIELRWGVGKTNTFLVAVEFSAHCCVCHFLDLKGKTIFADHSGKPATVIENLQYQKGGTLTAGTSDEGTADEGSPENTIDKSMAPLNVDVEGAEIVVSPFIQ